MGAVVRVCHCRIKVMPWHSRGTNFLSKKAFRPKSPRYKYYKQIWLIVPALLSFWYEMRGSHEMAVKITVYQVWRRVLRCSSEKRPFSVFKGGGTLLPKHLY